MTPHYQDDLVTLYAGDCLDVLRELPDGSVEAVVTDPPYGLEFMGKDWDSFSPVDLDRGGRWTKDKRGTAGKLHQDTRRAYGRVAYGANRSYTSECRTCGRRDAFRNPHDCTGEPRWERTPVDDGAPPQMLAFQTWCEQWAAECLRVLKPGGHLLAFGGTRTWHRLACAIEDAGFEVRDSIAWMYGSGFPKSRNLSGEWHGWGTALKPAHEPIVVARKPLTGTVAANVLEHGTGALNIDGCRIEGEAWQAHRASGLGAVKFFTEGDAAVIDKVPHSLGRWPANVVLDEHQAAELDRQSGDDVGGASRFFYTAKAGTDERPRVDGVAHPTVKPVDLMRWLVRLVTPPGGTVLEPFAGSGTTAEACIIEGFHCIAIEREPDYLPLIVQRLTKPIQPTLGDL